MDKRKKEQAVNLLIEYRQELEAELNSINQTIHAINGSQGSQIQEKPRLLPNITENRGDDSDWENLTFQDAVLKFLKIHKDRPYRASEIALFLRKKGTRGSDKKSFSAMTATTVRRLCEKGKASKTTVNVSGRDVAAFEIKEEGYLL